MRGGSEYKFQVKERPGKGPSSGPVYLCVGNDALAELVEATPAERRKDLVCVCVCVCEREREREREHTHTHTYSHTSRAMGGEGRERERQGQAGR